MMSSCVNIFKLSTLDDILVEMKDARIFSKLDIKEAYWHVSLDLKSSLMTTMITPFGRFQWLRLPFGLKVSSEIFQRKLGEALEGLKSTINIADDIVLAGGAVAQSVERATPGEEVPGSILAVAARSLLVGSVSV